MNNKKNAARAERRQQKIDSGFVQAIFPEVSSIVINMTYNQRGLRQSLPRTVNFFPSSYAFFTVECLNKECVEGGFDFTRIISGMVGNRKAVTKGELGCQGGPVTDHSDIVYEVAISYV
ncbi:MAG: hypothetical protein HQL08_10060 [Nitrospirae bacterium]|nr:hypothetical protein [Nitrospirota bacterium]